MNSSLVGTIRTCIPLVFCLFLYHIPANSQEKDTILIKGDPPLTQLMIGKTIVLLDWLLDLNLNKAEEQGIRNILITYWNKKKKEDIKSITDFVEIYDKVSILKDEERSKIKQQMQPLMVEVLFNENDELSTFLVPIYRKSHPPISNPQMETSIKNKTKVGTDGFTGIYRMMRPRALNMNSSSFEKGYYIEHITFLPGGFLYWDLPPEGLLYFDPIIAQKKHPNDVGTYELKDGEIHIIRGPQKTKYIITRNGDKLNNPPSLGKGTFRPIPALDGLKIEGQYKRNAMEPSISFTKDGQFSDGGVFRFFGSISKLDGTAYMDDGIAGSGRYLVEQNTLELSYLDGRTKRFVIEAFPENLKNIPAIESFLLNGHRLERQ